VCCLILSFANWFSGTILYLSESQEETKDTQSDIWDSPRPMKTIALLKTSKLSLADYEVLKLQDLVKLAGKVLLSLYSKKISKDEIISQCRSDDRQKKQCFSEGCSLYLQLVKLAQWTDLSCLECGFQMRQYFLRNKEGAMVEDVNLEAK
jgi:hypothetical protein